ncbi:MAG TPA: hypothetical protein VFD72_00725 [Sphingobacteriaceae bacterium]|nr:hypothetical protein [Sphingobacteriaceae bacterium]
MKEFEELQQLWRKNVPDSKRSFEEVMRAIESGRKELATKMLWHVVAFAAGLLVLFYIWLTVPFVTWTSHLALLLLAACMVYALRAQWRSYKEMQFDALESGQKPEAFISRLKKFKADRYRQHTRSFVIYEVCLALAFVLYSIELYFALSLGVFIGMMIFIIFWFLISHFVFLKAYIDHENEKVQSLIDELDRIRNQFD